MIRHAYPAVLLCDLASALGWRSLTLRRQLDHVLFAVTARNEDGPERLAVPVADAAACLGFDPDDLIARLGSRIITA